MTVAHLWRAIQDKSTGRLLLGASVTLCNPGTNTSISSTLYADVGLTQMLPNPFISTNGVIDVYLDTPQSVLLLTSYGTASEQADNIPVLPLPEHIVTTVGAFTISNDPGAGLVLLGVDGETASFQTLPEVLVDTAAAALGWFLAGAFQYSSIVRDINGAMLTADVRWPDGLNGSYITDLVSPVLPGRVDAWHVTRTDGVTTATYTQPTMTRDASGNITTKPLVVVT